MWRRIKNDILFPFQNASERNPWLRASALTASCGRIALAILKVYTRIKSPPMAWWSKMMSICNIIFGDRKNSRDSGVLEIPLAHCPCEFFLRKRRCEWQLIHRHLEEFPEEPVPRCGFRGSSLPSDLGADRAAGPWLGESRDALGMSRGAFSCLLRAASPPWHPCRWGLDGFNRTLWCVTSFVMLQEAILQSWWVLLLSLDYLIGYHHDLEVFFRQFRDSWTLLYEDKLFDIYIVGHTSLVFTKLIICEFWYSIL